MTVRRHHIFTRHLPEPERQHVSFAGNMVVVAVALAIVIASAGIFAHFIGAV
jgi:hypothetical protein